jgi:hypothetical protein
LRNTYRRTHRWEKTARHEDDLAAAGEEDRLMRVLFSTNPEVVGIYGKPMARNSQIWTDQYELLLDGPRAGRKELQRAVRVLRRGGSFGYRIYYPPMRVGKYEVFWHLPLHGEVRLPRDMCSSLYNTDGQIFSDAGIPLVLFMENYDINRVGYHDTYDNMTNIDLDYGAALAAIVIESVARAATEKEPNI